MKYRGVTFDKSRGKYKAACYPGDRCMYLGRFNTAKEAAQVYDNSAIALFGDNAQLNFGGRQATIFQEQCYRLCSPDFYGLTHWQAALLLHTQRQAVSLALQRLKQKCPTLFPMYHRRHKMIRYEEWMSNQIKRKF